MWEPQPISGTEEEIDRSLLQSSNAPSFPLREATGWRVASDGQVELVETAKRGGNPRDTPETCW
ncbi:hypothetical protein [Baaleninema sp.]|uniref:hypothetical protein n=1 Tax=Baaleninema sp. TaxID=3101197 RepID=UPI003D07E8F6